MIRIKQDNNLITTLSIEAAAILIELPTENDSILPIIEMLIPDGRLVSIFDKKGEKVKDYLITQDEDFLAAIAFRFIQNDYAVEITDVKTKFHLSEIEKKVTENNSTESQWEGIVF